MSCVTVAQSVTRVLQMLNCTPSTGACCMPGWTVTVTYVLMIICYSRVPDPQRQTSYQGVLTWQRKHDDNTNAFQLMMR